MELPDTHYAKSADGAYIAYQVIGDGPIDVVSLSDWPGNIDVEQEEPLGVVFFRELASFSRAILHDRRGIGLSSRNVPLPNLETRVSDLLLVLDAVGSARPVLVGVFESGAPAALLAATRPDRVHSVVWMEPTPRFAWAPDYPWGRTETDMENELRDIELWGTRAYGQAFLRDEANRGNLMPDALAAHMAKASRNACTPDVARALSHIWYESDVRERPSRHPGAHAHPVVARPRRRLRSLQVRGVVDPGGEFREMPGEVSVRGRHGAQRRGDPAVRGRRATRRPNSIPSCRPCCSPTSSARPRSKRRSAITAGRSWSKRHHAIVRDALGRWRGVENDTAGDGFYATFDGPARAIRCAQEVGRGVRDLGIEIRAGVHTGECELIDGKCGGLTVSIGARVAALAGPSEVLVSQTVKDLVAGSGLTFEDAGEHELKGVPDRWHLYRVVA